MMMRQDELVTAPFHSPRMIRGRLLLSACLGIPLSLLVGSYVWLAVDHGTLRLWSEVVHEGGRHSLQHTIFYFSHFLREIPVDVAYALFLATNFARTKDISRDIVSAGGKRAVVLAAGGTAVAAGLALAAMAVAAMQQGFGSALHDLLQYRTRDDLSAYGSHWHFHWLSTIWFGAMAMLIVPLEAAVFPADDGKSRSRRMPLAWIPWMYVLAATLVFGVSSDTIMDVRYAGHQAREILTHGTITALLGLGSLHLASNWLRSGRSLSEKSPLPILRRNRGTWIALALFFAIPLFLALVSWSGDIMEAGQSEHGLAAMVGGHVFEHVLDYAFVAILAVGTYGFLMLDSTNHGNKR